MTEKLMLEPTTTAQWKQLLQHAEQQCQYQLNEDVESYLIFTLIRFTQNPSIASKALAPDLLNTTNLTGQARQQQLRDVGDQCLLLSGLFPQQAERRLVKVSYYVDLGRTAYIHLSELLKQAFADLYQQLSNHFVQMMDILQNIRSEPALLPLQALEQWQDTGSQNGRRILSGYSSATPIIINNPIRH